MEKAYVLNKLGVLHQQKFNTKADVFTASNCQNIVIFLLSDKKEVNLHWTVSEIAENCMVILLEKVTDSEWVACSTFGGDLWITFESLSEAKNVLFNQLGCTLYV